MKNILTCIFLLSALWAKSSAIIYTDGHTKEDISSSLKILKDNDNNMTIEQVLLSPDFKSVNKNDVANFGISSSTFWVRFNIKNRSSYPKLLLEIANPILHSIEMYEITDYQLKFIERSGNKYSKKNKVYPYAHELFEINFDNNSIKTFLLKVEGKGLISFPLFIGSPESILKSMWSKNMFYGFYLGAMLLMFFYILLIYLSSKKKVHLYYLFFVFSQTLMQMNFEGFASLYLWPDNLWFKTKSITIFLALSGYFAILFAQNFIQKKNIYAKYNRGLSIFLNLYFIILIMSFLGIDYLAHQMAQVVVLFASLFLIYISYKTSLQGYKSAKIFFTSWIIFLLGVVIYILRSMGVLPYDAFTSYILPVGTIIQANLLAIALVDKMNDLRREREKARLKELKAKDNELLLTLEKEHILLEQNDLLEREVDLATKTLQEQNKKLEYTLKELKNKEQQLVQSEKLASLGRMAAGIAHEINNPMNFVQQSTYALKKDIDDIKNLVTKYKKLLYSPSSTRIKQDIKAYEASIDLDFTYDEIDQLLSDIHNGVSRTTRISQDLRTFSRVDHKNIIKADIHEGIDSTIRMLSFELKDGIRIEKKYGILPEIHCNAQKIQQVFMNILSNAIHAVTKNELNSSKGLIVIETFFDQKNQHVYISFEDNGCGMSQETIDHIFDPFYTTKEVGKGTGLGLSISYGIIQDHNGHIQVESTLGKGTKFIIRFPKSIKI